MRNGVSIGVGKNAPSARNEVHGRSIGIFKASV